MYSDKLYLLLHYLPLFIYYLIMKNHLVGTVTFSYSPKLTLLSRNLGDIVLCLLHYEISYGTEAHDILH